MKKLDRIINDAHALTELANRAMDNINAMLENMEDPAVQSEYTIEEFAREGARLRKRLENLRRMAP